jgi:hypothetical protein
LVCVTGSSLVRNSTILVILSVVVAVVVIVVVVVAVVFAFVEVGDGGVIEVVGVILV